MNKIRVLVVDDQEEQAKPLSAYLKNNGFLVEIETNPFLVKSRVLDAHYDIILLDLLMPEFEYDGLDVLVDIKTFSQSTKVIMMTGQATRGIVAQAMRLGAADYIDKNPSINSQEYVQIIHKVLKPLREKEALEGLIDYRWKRMQGAGSDVQRLQLEGLLQLLFESIDGFNNIVVSQKNISNKIDIEFENSRSDAIWKDFLGLVWVRCQNWSKADQDDSDLTLFSAFQKELASRKGLVKLGFFITSRKPTSLSLTTPDSIDRLRLARYIDDRFSVEEFRDLCFMLKIDYGELPAGNKKNKVNELVLMFERRDRLPELLETCQNYLPEMDWNNIVISRTESDFDKPLSILIDYEDLVKLVDDVERETLLKGFIKDAIR